MTAVPHIDFAQPQGPLRRRRHIAGWVLLALALATTGVTVGRNFSLRQHIQTETSRLERLRPGGEITRQSPELATPAYAAEMEAVNRVIRRLSVPWGRLFQAVEAAKSTRVFILSMKPDVQQRDLNLSGEADDFPAVTEFIGALGRQPILAQVRLTGHETRPTGQIHFEISAQWQP